MVISNLYCGDIWINIPLNRRKPVNSRMNILISRLFFMFILLQMGRKKLQRFADNAERKNVVEPGKAVFEEIKGRWRSVQFDNDHPLVLELACGKGEYTVGLAQIFPGQNFIGVDIKGSRIWKGSQEAIDRSLANVAFLRIQIQLLDHFFDEGEVDDIWIVFPDPQPGHEKKRLTHPRFLEMYKKILRAGGKVRLKTDSELLFEYTLQTLRNRIDIKDLVITDDLYHSGLLSEHFGIRTRYENQYAKEGRRIRYLRFSFAST